MMCPLCKQDHDPSDIQSNGYCRTCGSAYRRAHYIKNKHKYKAKAKAWNKKVTKINRAIMIAHLTSHSCVDCGESDPIVLEFDHRDPEKKLFAISAGVFNRKPEIFQAEIDKCDVRCANCHRRKTAKENGWSKHYFAPLA